MYQENYLFDRQKTIGKKGEGIFYKFFSSFNKVIDVSENAKFQPYDIDFIVNDKYYVELKTSTTIQKNQAITIELITNKDANKKGWFLSSRADVFFFLDIKNMIFYACRADELRELYNKNAYLSFEYKSKEYENGTEKISVLCYIPLQDIKKLKSFKCWEC